jgi:hypothetical protein
MLCAQTAMPTQSFVFNMKPGVMEGNAGLNGIVATVEKGDKSVTCSTLTKFMTGFEVTIDKKANPTRGYVVHVFRFQDDDESEQSHVWYSYDTAWYDEKKGCNIGFFKEIEGFSPIQALTDPTAGWFRGSQSFRDQRLWGTTDVATLTVLDTTATPSYKAIVAIEHIKDETRKQILAALTGPKAGTVAAHLCSQAATYTKLKADCDTRAGGTPLAHPTSDQVNDIAAKLEDEFINGQSDAAFSPVIAYGDKVDRSSWVAAKFCPHFAAACAESEKQTRLAPSWLPQAIQSKLKYQWDVTKTVPQPVQNLQTALSQGASASATGASGLETLTLTLTAADISHVYIYGAQARTVSLVPSSVKVTGTLTPPAAPPNQTQGNPGALVPAPGTAQKSSDASSSTTALGSTTYVNEGRYWWNVSVAAPLKSVKTLTYNTGSLSPQSLDNKAGYAAFDVYFHKVDVTNTSLRLTPAFFGGPSFTGKFLDRWMVGVSIGAWYVEPFWGYTFLAANLPVNPNDTTNKATYKQWTHAPVWGINIPIRSFYKLATNNSSKTTSAAKSK